MTVPASDHFNGKTFFQPGSQPARSFWDVLRWKVTSRPAKWPHHVPLAPQPPPPAPREAEIVATWLGHASFLLQTTQGNVLLDPVFSERASPVSWIGPRRAQAVPLPLESLPELDAVCISHDHYDHCDAPTLRALARTQEPLFVAPLRHHDLLRSIGAKRIVELDWWQSTTLGRGLRITLTPTKHWTKRLGTPRNYRLWGGFWIEVPANRPAAVTPAEPTVYPKPIVVPPAPATRSVWFVGDSGYDKPFFAELHRRLGCPDLALIPIGAYAPRWFMAPMHINPEEAVRLHRDSGAKLSVAMHWGTFQLTDEARDAPVQALDEARRRQGVTAEEFRVLEPGASLVV